MQPQLRWVQAMMASVTNARIVFPRDRGRSLSVRDDQKGGRRASIEIGFALSDIALTPGIIAWAFLVALCFSMGGSNAFADMLTGATCPPDFTCFSIEPRDGACLHPAIVLDEQTKSTMYEGDRFSRAYEKACIAKTNSLVTRRGSELRLKLGNGTVKLYNDFNGKAACENGPDANCKTYLLYDYFPEHRLFLVHIGYDEDQGWILVNQVDGKEQKIVAPPDYSPSRKWLASVYATDGGDDENNGIDIVPADLNPVDSGFHYRPKEYEQWEFVRWDSDDRLSLKVTWRVGNDPDLVTWPAEVIRVNGKWQLERRPPASSRP
jgi:hypothetical protein